MYDINILLNERAEKITIYSQIDAPNFQTGAGYFISCSYAMKIHGYFQI